MGEKESFTVTCNRCGRTEELSDVIIDRMKHEHTNSIMAGEDLFRTYVINLNFGNAGGYGTVELRCKCGYGIDGTE